MFQLCSFLRSLLAILGLLLFNINFRIIFYCCKNCYFDLDGNLNQDLEVLSAVPCGFQLYSHYTWCGSNLDAYWPMNRYVVCVCVCDMCMCVCVYTHTPTPTHKGMLFSLKKGYSTIYDDMDDLKDNIFSKIS